MGIYMYVNMNLYEIVWHIYKYVCVQGLYIYAAYNVLFMYVMSNTIVVQLWQ